VVSPALGVDSLGALIARARAAPGRIAYASAGVGTADHLSAALLAKRADVQLIHVPYANSGAEIKDLLNGEVKVAFITVGAVRALLATGQLKALAVTGRTRIAAYPDVPTIAESGYPGFEVTSWYGVLAPAGTPRTVIERIGGEIARIMQSPELREKCYAMGCESAPTTPDEFAAEIGALMKQWPPIVRSAGIAVE
jgi:tripartite-type tricarboxylate transporter receptor subunit TctC